MKKYTTIRWICVQNQENGNYWYYEPSIQYTRKGSIKACIEGSTLTWEQAKKEFKWSCIRIELSMTPILNKPVNT